MVSTPEERIEVMERRIEAQLALIDSQQTELEEERRKNAELGKRIALYLIQRDEARALSRGAMPPFRLAISHCEGRTEIGMYDANTGDTLYSSVIEARE